MIKEIISHPASFSNVTLFTAFAMLFPLQILAMGLAVPAGIFMPSILCGCSLGALFGNIVKSVLDGSNTTPYALLGAVAILGGTQRTTISLCVIMMEGTGQTAYILPIILTTGTSHRSLLESSP